MEEQKVVADASVVANWFLEEEFSDNARTLRDSFVTGGLIISVLSLLFYEALNALRYSGVYSEDELAIARSISKYGFDVPEPRGEVYEETARLSLKHDISVYDASYVALAPDLKTSPYTADDALNQKFPKNTKHISILRPTV